MEDEELGASLEPGRHELVELFRRAFEKLHRLDEDLDSLLTSAVPLGVLSDIIAQALGLHSETKCRLLAEPQVELRLNTLLSILREILENDDAPRGFPPYFSTN